MRWFEPNLQKVLCEAGKQGLRIGIIVRNVCNLEPTLFGVQHPYHKAYSEIYTFLRKESTKPHPLYHYKKNGKDAKHGKFTIDRNRLNTEQQTTLNL